MKLVIAALAMVAAMAPNAVQGQAGSPSRASIPAQFHGRWAENQAACATEHFLDVITINQRGWASFEQGGEAL